MYSHKDEEKHIVEYFGDTKGRFLDIGASDGILLSNTRRLVELGWNGVCIEPSPFFFRNLVLLYKDDPEIVLVNTAIDFSSKWKEFYDSMGDFISSLDQHHRELWESETCKFRRFWLKTTSVLEMFETFGYDFSFINLDAEGLSSRLIKFFPFPELKNLRLICVEHDDLYDEIEKLTKDFGFKRLAFNSENLLLAR